jgi:hypothetical protein
VIDGHVVGAVGAVLVGVLVGLAFARREARRRRAAAATAPDRSGAALVSVLRSYCDAEGDQGMPEVLLAVWRARFVWEVYNLVPERPDVRVDGQLLEWDGMPCVTAFSSKEAAHGSGIARDPYALVESTSGHVLSLVMQDHVVGGLVLDAGSDHTLRIPKQWVAEFLHEQDDDEGH